MTQLQYIGAPNKCVWTDAGVLRDRLCDRAFTCDACPLDAALRKSEFGSIHDDSELTFEIVVINNPEGLGSIPTPVVSPFLRLPLCNECRYSPSHIWMRRDTSGLYWCGFDAFAASLLPEYCDIVSVARNTYVTEGEPCAWVYAGELCFPLLAPLSGTFATRLPEADIDMHSIREQPYSSGAFFAILPDQGAYQRSRGRSALEQASRFRHDVRRLVAALTRTIRRHEAETGICLNDGGETVNNVRELLGDKSWSALVRSFLSGE